MSDARPGGSRCPRPSAGPGADAFHLSPFARLARAHALAAAGDALVTIALAGSLFFDLDPNDARWKVFLYLPSRWPRSPSSPRSSARPSTGPTAAAAG